MQCQRHELETNPLAGGRRRDGALLRGVQGYHRYSLAPHMKYTLIAFAIGALVGYFGASTIKSVPGFSQLNAAINPQM